MAAGLGEGGAIMSMNTCVVCGEETENISEHHFNQHPRQKYNPAWYVLEEFPKIITVYSHASKESRRQNAEENAQEGTEAYEAIRGLGYEIDTKWLVYEDGSKELVSVCGEELDEPIKSH